MKFYPESNQRTNRLIKPALSEHLEVSMAFDLYTFRSLNYMLDLLIDNPLIIQYYLSGQNDILGRYEKHLELFLHKAELVSRDAPHQTERDPISSLKKSFKFFTDYAVKSREMACLSEEDDPIRIIAEEMLYHVLRIYERKVDAYYQWADSRDTEDLLDEMTSILHRYSKRPQPARIENQQTAKKKTFESCAE